MLDPVRFKGHIADDVPPAPERRIRGKTSRASVARGESRQIESGAEGDDLLGGELEGERAGSGGVCMEDEEGEFEGMVPDSVLWDEEQHTEAHVSLRNLWSEPLKCKLCDAARTHGWASDRCESCGT